MCVNSMRYSSSPSFCFSLSFFFSPSFCFSLSQPPLYTIVKMLYRIVTCTRQTLSLVNTRAGSALALSRFSCYYFTKQIPIDFPCRILWSKHLGCCSTFEMPAKKHSPIAARVLFFTLFKSLATSCVFGSKHPVRKTIWYFFILVVLPNTMFS